MDQVHVIRHKVLVEGISARKTARDLGVSRNTVKKYLTQSEPIRIEAVHRQRPVLDRVRGRIDELLDEWADRTTRKQRITGSRIHRQLIDEGYKIGSSSVRDYLRKTRLQKSEVMIPLVWTAGEAAQVDFFEVTVDVAGVRQKAWMFLMRLMYSGRDFAAIYERCDQISFLHGHVLAFEHFGGVPHRCIYDNLKAAVKKIVGCHRELSGRFLALVSHYLFEASFARPGEGHDKGGVESRGKAIRLRHLTPIPRGQSVNEISKSLLKQIDLATTDKRHGNDKTIAALFEEEKQKLLPLNPVRFEARRTQSVCVYSNSKVRIENAWYSVPTWWPRTEVTALVGVDTIEFLHHEKSVTHPRVKPGEQSILYRHYLPELARKPQAVRQVAAKLLDEIGEPFGELWRLLVDCHGPHDAARAFAKVIQAIVDHGESRVKSAIMAAVGANENHLNFLVSLHTPKRPKFISVPKSLAGYEVITADVREFDALMHAGGEL